MTVPAACYRVSVQVDAAVAAEWLEWMQATHIPDVLATGCFTGCTVTRQVEPVASRGRESFLLEYGLVSLERFAEYEARFAAALRQAHTARFAGRFDASRSLGEVIGRLEPPTA